MMIFECLSVSQFDGARPVYWIVMALFLTIIGWRVGKSSQRQAARCIQAGVLALGIGYGLLLPMHEAGLVMRGEGTAVEMSFALWNVASLVLMNGGWLFLGLGLAFHAKLLQWPQRKSAAAKMISPQPHSPPPPHESMA